MKMIKRFSLLSFVFILACSIVGCQQIDASQEQKQFDQFIQQEFVKTMENDYVATHKMCIRDSSNNPAPNICLFSLYFR